MEVEAAWIIAGLKGCILTVSGFVVNHYRKPFYIWAKAQINLNDEYKKLKDRVIKLEGELFVIDGRQRANIHTDNQPAFKINGKGDMIYANPAWGALFEYDDIKNAYGVRFMDVIHPDDYERIKMIHSETIESPTGFNDFIKFRTKKTKKTINTICVTELVHDKNGDLESIMGRLHVLDSS